MKLARNLAAAAASMEKLTELRALVGDNVDAALDVAIVAAKEGFTAEDIARMGGVFYTADAFGVTREEIRALGEFKWKVLREARPADGG